MIEAGAPQTQLVNFLHQVLAESGARAPPVEVEAMACEQFLPGVRPGYPACLLGWVGAAFDSLRSAA